MTDPEQWYGGLLGIDEPAVARMYDYYLGGSHNFAADRAAARAAIDAVPQIVTAARENRAFLGRVVEFAATQGIGQFLDLGCGLLTVGNVHQIAHAHDPDARVVHVDHDPTVVAHAREVLSDDPRVAVLGEDINKLSALLPRIHGEGLIDLDQPLAVLLTSVLHFIDGHIPALLHLMRELVVPGSLLAISHATTDIVGYEAWEFDAADCDPQQLTNLQKVYAATSSQFHPRSRAAILAMFAGFPLVSAHSEGEGEGGERRLVPVDAWRPEPGHQPQHLTRFVAGVGIRSLSVDAFAALPHAGSTPASSQRRWS